MGIVTSALYFAKSIKSDDFFSNIPPNIKKDNNFYGCKRDEYDHRDFMYKMPIDYDEPETSYDMRTVDDLKLPRQENLQVQRNTGSNTVDSCLYMVQFERMRNKEVYDDFIPSQDFVYWNHRYKTNSVMSDTGSSMRNTLHVLYRIGVCDNTLLATKDLEEDELYTQHPSDFCFCLAKFNKINNYYRIENKKDNIKYILTKNTPISFGFTVFTSFEDDEFIESGNLSMPNDETENTIGAHSAVIIGYDDDKQVYIVRDSQGDTHGDNGYIYVPYDYVSKYGFDFWCINQKKDD